MAKRQEFLPEHSLQGWRSRLQRFTPEALADQSPRLYRTLLNVIGSLGYGVVFGLPLLSLLLAVYLGVQLLGEQPATLNTTMIWLTVCGFVLCTWASLELYLVHPPTPSGIAIHREISPHLYAMIERRTEKFRANQIHNVLLTRDHHVRVVRTPRNGFLLQSCNTLCLGAPLLHMLSRRQFRIMLRCAIGQFAHYKDANLGELVIMGENLQSLRSHLQQCKTPGAWVLRGFLAVYLPVLLRYSLPAAKEHALNHDLYGTEITPDQEMLEIIAAETVTENYLSRCFWPMLLNIANHKANPTVRPFSNFEPMVQQTLNKNDAERWLLQAMATPEDRHLPQPSLRTRIGALGYNALEFTGLPQETSVHLVLGDATTTLLNKLDHAWRDEIREEWKQRHDQYKQEQERFEKLHQRFHHSSLEGEAAIKYAHMARKYLHQGEAIEVYTHLQEYNQNDPEVVFQMGKLLMEAGLSRGRHAIEQAVAMDKRYASKASVIISKFMMTQKTGPTDKSRSETALRRSNDHQDIA